MGPSETLRTVPGLTRTVITPWGKETYQVLLEESGAGWLARIVTLPNRVWATPDGREAVKFHGATASEAEAAAADFIEQERVATGRRLWAPRAHSREAVAGPPVEIVTVQPRVATRIAQRFLLRFGPSQPQLPGVTGNLSESGLFIITDRPACVGSEVKVDLRFPDSPVLLGAEVVWIRPEKSEGLSVGCGVRLLQRPAEYLERIHRLVQAYATR